MGCVHIGNLAVEGSGSRLGPLFVWTGGDETCMDHAKTIGHCFQTSQIQTLHFCPTWWLSFPLYLIHTCCFACCSQMYPTSASWQQLSEDGGIGVGFNADEWGSRNSVLTSRCTGILSSNTGTLQLGSVSASDAPRWARRWRRSLVDESWQNRWQTQWLQRVRRIKSGTKQPTHHTSWSNS